MSSTNGVIRPIIPVVNSCLSSINPTSSSHFCAIVALLEAHFDRRHLQIFDFCEFQEYEARNEASRAKICVRRTDAEIGVVAAHHLGGLLGVDVGGERCGGAKWLGEGNQTPETHNTCVRVPENS